MVFAAAIANVNTLDLFNSKELYLSASQLVDHKVSVWYMFNTMWITPSLSKTLTKFNLLKVEDLFVLVVPTVQAHAKTINEAHIVFRQSTKLTPDQCSLKFNLYMKHDNVNMYDAFMWNYNKCIICNDAIFIPSYINEVIGDKVQWPSLKEHATVAQHMPKFQGPIKLINGTFIEIHKP